MRKGDERLGQDLNQGGLDLVLKVLPLKKAVLLKRVLPKKPLVDRNFPPKLT